MSNPNTNISPITGPSPTQLGSITMGTYISFSIIFFIVALFIDWDMYVYVLIFWISTFCLQFAMNLYGTGVLCGSPDPLSAFKYTIVPWLLVLGIASGIILLMPGWVRVFSNTIGLAVVKSVYLKVFEVDSTTKPAQPDLPAGQAPSPEKYKQDELINQIYNDPTKLINEVGYKSGYRKWVMTIYKDKLSKLEFFNNTKFTAGLEAAEKLSESNPDLAALKKVETNLPLYELYKCIAVKEKVGYFIWLFLIGSISVLTSLDEILNGQCSGLNPNVKPPS